MPETEFPPEAAGERFNPTAAYEALSTGKPYTPALDALGHPWVEDKPIGLRGRASTEDLVL